MIRIISADTTNPVFTYPRKQLDRFILLQHQDYLTFPFHSTSSIPRSRTATEGVLCI